MADEHHAPNNLPANLSPEVRDVVQEVDPLIQGLPEGKRAQVRSIFARVTQTHRGPLPSPKTLQVYNELIPSGAERMMALVERRSAHRIKQEDRIVEADIKLALRGQLLAAGLTVLALGVAVYAAYLEHQVLAAAICTTTIIGLVTVFVLGKRPSTSGGEEEGEEEEEEDDSDDEHEDAREAAARVQRRKERRGR